MKKHNETNMMTSLHFYITNGDEEKSQYHTKINKTGIKNYTNLYLKKYKT